MKIPQEEITKAVATLEQALQDDGHDLGSLAHVWFCNIKMPAFDILCLEGADTAWANRVSAKMANMLMQHLFHFNSDFE